MLQDGHLRENKASRSPTFRRTGPLTGGSETPVDEENAGDWSESTSTTDTEVERKRKQRRLKQSARGRARAISKAGEDTTLANLSFLKRVSISHATETKIQNASGAIPQLCGRGKTGARRGRQGRQGNRATPKHELQPMPTCERRTGPTGGASLLPTSIRKARWTKTRSTVESLRAEERALTRSRRPLPRMIWFGVCWKRCETRNL